MIFDKFFEVGLIVIGLLWVGDQILDSIIHLYDVQVAVEMREKEMKMENEIPESMKRMYS